MGDYPLADQEPGPEDVPVKLRTWHLEGIFVASWLAGALFSSGRYVDWREWVAALGVQLGFHHASVADRLREAAEKRLHARAEGAKRMSDRSPDEVEQGVGEFIYHVECVAWLQRYWVLKEIAWVVYFLSTGAVSALVGCAVFLAHPFWRRWYRRRRNA